MSIKKNQTARYFCTEYKKHFFKNIIPLMCYAILFIVVNVLVLMGLKQYSIPNISNLKALHDGKYEYVVESSEKYEQFVGMYKLDNLVSVYNKDDKHYNVNYYMKNEYATIDNLQEIGVDLGELVLSKKVADKIGVRVGDFVDVDLPISDEKSSFKVIEIIPYLNDYYNVVENTDFSVAIIGYDEKFEKATSGKYVYLLSTDEMNQFIADELSYKEIYEISQECNKLEVKTKMAQWITYLVFVIISFFYVILINREIISESKKYYYDVVGVGAVKKIYWLDHIIFYVLPMMIFYALLGHFSKYKLFDEKFCLAIVVVSVGHFLIIQMGGNKFGKANRI